MEPGTVDDVHARSKRDTRQRKPPERPDALLRTLVEQATFDLALLFTKGQYLLYSRDGGELRVKGVSVKTLRMAFVGEPIDSGWLPCGVIRSGTGPAGPFAVQFLPPRRQTISLLSPRSKTLKTITVPLPGIVFAGVQATYWVWAVREEVFSPEAAVYQVPLPNVYPDGRICFGQNTPPAVSPQTMSAAWQLFLESPFNADLVGSKSMKHPKDVCSQLLALRGAECYPVDDLVSAARRTGYYTSSPVLTTVDDMVNTCLLKHEPGRQNEEEEEEDR